MSPHHGPFEWRDAPDADFAVIGDPVAHSMSPQMHQAAYDALDLPYRYVAIHVGPGEVGAALTHLAELGYRGVNVTVPHKLAALEWASKPDPLAVRLMAANTLRLSDGSCINTDCPGFRDVISDFLPASRVAVLLGAGGSARAVAVALQMSGYEVRLWNRTRSTADALAAVLGIPIDSVLDRPTAGGASIVVNATSGALTGQDVAVDWSGTSVGLACHLMYGPKAQPFLSEAAQHGFEPVDGRSLLVAQGALSFEWWLGRPAPRAEMMAALQ